MRLKHSYLVINYCCFPREKLNLIVRPTDWAAGAWSAATSAARFHAASASGLVLIPGRASATEQRVISRSRSRSQAQVASYSWWRAATQDALERESPVACRGHVMPRPTTAQNRPGTKSTEFYNDSNNPHVSQSYSTFYRCHQHGYTNLICTLTSTKLQY